MMTEHTLIDSGAVAELDHLLSSPVAVQEKLRELASAARVEFEAREARLDRKIEQMIAQAAAKAAELDAREKTLTQREAAVTEREREAEAKRQWAIEHEAAVAHRAADLQQRYSGAK